MKIKMLEMIRRLLVENVAKKEVEYAEAIRETADAEAKSETGEASEEIRERLDNARKEKWEALDMLCEFEKHEFS